MVTEMRREDTLRVSDSPKVYSARMRNLQELRKNRTFCDVVLQVENIEIYAHRSVLACASPYFFELFTADDEIKTATEEKLIYKLNCGLERDSIECLITYAYTGELEVTSSQVKSVYIAAIKLKMDESARACGEHLVGSLTPETCLDLRAIPGISCDPHLVSAIDHYIQQQSNLLNVTQGAHGVPTILLNVIHGSRDEAGIMMRALCNLSFEWVRKQMEEEELTLSSLSEKTHLLYLNLDNSLHDCTDIESGAVNDCEMVQDYKKFSRKSQPHMKLKRKGPVLPQPVKPRMMLFSRSISDDNDHQDGDWKLIAHSRVSDNSVVAIVTLNNVVAVLSIQQQLSAPVDDVSGPSRPPSVEKVDSYTLIPHMRSPKCGSGVGTLAGKLIVCGGYDRGECLLDVEGYNPHTNVWESLPDMTESRGRFDLTVVGGQAFAVGGCNGCRELDSVEIYEEATGGWSQVASLPLARSNTGVCSLNGKVYCIGGWNGQLGIRQCDVYDPETDVWTIIEPLHAGRYQAGVASLQGKVYAVGGCDSWNCLNSMEMIEPHQGTWKHASSMSTPRRGCGLAALNGCLYVVGGSDGTHSLCSTEIYDPETNSWSAGPPMTSCRANVGVAVLNGRLYAVGGFSGKVFLNSIEFLDPQTNEWTTFTPKPDNGDSNPSVVRPITNGISGTPLSDPPVGPATSPEHNHSKKPDPERSDPIDICQPLNSDLDLDSEDDLNGVSDDPRNGREWGNEVFEEGRREMQLWH